MRCHVLGRRRQHRSCTYPVVNNMTRDQLAVGILLLFGHWRAWHKLISKAAVNVKGGFRIRPQLQDQLVIRTATCQVSTWIRFGLVVLASAKGMLYVTLPGVVVGAARHTAVRACT